VLEKTPPELASDISSRGIVMTGGGSLLYGLNKLLEKRTGIPTYIAEDAVSCVAKGTGMSLEHIDILEKNMMTPTKKRYL
jgi:rod shape-determining protein MreB